MPLAVGAHAAPQAAGEDQAGDLGWAMRDPGVPGRLRLGSELAASAQANAVAGERTKRSRPVNSR